MTALAKSRKTDKMGPEDSADPLLLAYGVAASTKGYAGGIAALNASGYLVPASASPTLRVVGRLEEDFDNSSGANNAFKRNVRRGAYYYGNSAGADAIAITDIGKFAYVVDDQTVSKTDGAGQRPPAGVIVDVRADGQIGVMLGEPSLFDLPQVDIAARLGEFKARAVITSIAAYTAVAGVLTANANGAIGAQDGVTLVAGDLVMLQAGITNVTAADAGPYVVTQVGTGGTPFILTRPNWYAHGDTIQPGIVVDVGGEGSAWSGSQWKALCGKAQVVGTNDPKFYPRVVKGTQALTAGAATVNNLQVWTAAQASALDTTAAAATKAVLTAGQGNGSIALTGTTTDTLAYVITNW